MRTQSLVEDMLPSRIGDSAEGMTLVEGTSFCIGDRHGDLVDGREHGLFVRDQRILSRWRLSVDGREVRGLSIESEAPFAATFVTHVPMSDHAASAHLVVLRHRFLGNGLREEIVLRNDTAVPVQCTVRLAAGTDLLSIFDAKCGRTEPTIALTRSTGTELQFGRGVGVDRVGVVVRCAAGGAVPGGFEWPATVPARSQWRVVTEVMAVADGHTLPVRHLPVRSMERSDTALRPGARESGAPSIETASAGFGLTLRRSVEDLAALRIHDPAHPDRPVIAAGAPWYMALFGRDSLLTSWMLLPIDSALGLGTLQTLAAYQGVRSDDESEEEPGRILHEVRFGRGTPFGSANVYYGTADATALFVMLAAELRRWRGREPETDALLPHVDRALAWLTAQTDLHGFVRYRRRTPNGLANQGWKDSWDGITFADGRIPDSPIALAEVQAYTYAAYSARAEWASELGDHAAETSWRRRAMQLRSDFDSAFWLPDSGWYALGLDRSGSAIDALSSNVGHCLWTGIADEARAPELAQHLLSPEMFSGWGIRTLATTMQAYDPMSYHNGSVWPHDTALCVAGLMRYGFVSCAWQVARGLLDAAVHFRGRLPELYGGFPRSDLRHPVPYPTSCSPQAWSSAAPLLVLRALLGLEPDVVGRTVRCSPHIPSELLPLVMSDVPIGAERITVSVHPDWWEVTGLRGSGLALESDPSIRWFPGGRYACTGGL